ncbi:sugar ABC transporter substrate-binding protein [Vallitalea maricola]|uniref:Sugar ABC transporter substrate-binding protein n=1 Tax=Vallitalea maricola TaxID=3074433 RepID=A0ACB5UJH2_9FIRM|nr:sugar ABC transporter substrate-binding protein [Vallitalea sp. AN17-2]
MKRLLKSMLSIMIVLTVIFTNVGCSQNKAPEKENNVQDSKENAKEDTKDKETITEDEQKTIAVLIPGPVGYFVAVRKGIDEAAEELGVKVEYADAGWDASKQLSQVEDFITKGVDMIAICAADAVAVVPTIQLANDAKVPIMAFTNAIGTNPTGEYEGLVTYVGQNEIHTGAVCGEIAKKLLGEQGGKIVMIEGSPGTSPQRNRREGFVNAIDSQENMDVVYTQTSNWEKEKAMKIVEDLIQKNQEMDLIFCQDDNSAIGAGKALEEAGMKDDIFVIGLGGSIDGLQAVKDGLLDGTTYMSATEEGYKTIETAVKYLNGEEVEKVTQMIQVEVNKDNVDEFEGEW